MRIVWVPWATDWNEDETEVTSTEQAQDADLSAEDPKTQGPVRISHYNAVTSELLDQSWSFQEVEWVAPTGIEEEAIAAWVAWQALPP